MCLASCCVARQHPLVYLFSLKIRISSHNGVGIVAVFVTRNSCFRPNDHKSCLILGTRAMPYQDETGDGHMPFTSTYPSALGSNPLCPNALVWSRVTHVFHSAIHQAADYLSPESPRGVYLLKSLAICSAPRTSIE